VYAGIPVINIVEYASKKVFDEIFETVIEMYVSREH